MAIPRNNKKDRGIVIAIPSNSNNDNFDNSQAGHCGFIGQGKILSVQNLDICLDSILPEHKVKIL